DLRCRETALGFKPFVIGKRRAAIVDREPEIQLTRLVDLALSLAQRTEKARSHVEDRDFNRLTHQRSRPPDDLRDRCKLAAIARELIARPTSNRVPKPRAAFQQAIWPSED